VSHYGPVHVVRDWLAAANEREADRVVELSASDVEVGGPRGIGFGTELLRQWISRAGLGLETRRVFARGDAVVVGQHAVWHSPATGAITGEAEAASCFRVTSGLVSRVVRFDSLDAALRDAGLSLQDEIAAL